MYIYIYVYTYLHIYSYMYSGAATEVFQYLDQRPLAPPVLLPLAVAATITTQTKPMTTTTTQTTTTTTTTTTATTSTTPNTPEKMEEEEKEKEEKRKEKKGEEEKEQKEKILKESISGETTIPTSLTAAEKKDENEEIKEDKQKGEEEEYISGVRGELNFENVSFAYPSRPAHKVLENLSLKVRGGESVALLGGSGSGKSTLFALALNFYAPSAGRVTIDGVDVRYDMQIHTRVCTHMHAHTHNFIRPVRVAWRSMVSI